MFADKQRTGYGDINPYKSLQKVLEDVSAYNPELLLVTGDLSSDGTVDSYQHFKALLAESKVSCDFKVLPGNHDSIDGLLAAFSEENLWSNSSALDLLDTWKIHLLNSKFKGTLGEVSIQDLEALRQCLLLNKTKHHFIAVHHHPITCTGWMDKHEWVNREAFTQLVESFPQVKVVIYGHIHTEIETNQNGVLYLACPSTCWQWAITKSFGLTEAMPGFRVMDLHENGEISHQVKHLIEV